MFWENDRFIKHFYREQASDLQLVQEASSRRCSTKGGFVNLAKFRAKHLCWSLFLTKLQALRYIFWTELIINLETER